MSHCSSCFVKHLKQCYIIKCNFQNFLPHYRWLLFKSQTLGWILQISKYTGHKIFSILLCPRAISDLGKVYFQGQRTCPHLLISVQVSQLAVKRRQSQNSFLFHKWRSAHIKDKQGRSQSLPSPNTKID